MSDWVDPDDAPILTAQIAARAEIKEGGKVVRRATGTITRMGRPPLGNAAKKQVTLRIDSEVLEAFRAGGAGWQSRMNDVLRKAVGGGYLG
jgi:uncharacterized protein (DUF4415 family)